MNGPERVKRTLILYDPESNNYVPEMFHFARIANIRPREPNMARTMPNQNWKRQLVIVHAMVRQQSHQTQLQSAVHRGIWSSAGPERGKLVSLVVSHSCRNAIRWIWSMLLLCGNNSRQSPNMRYSSQLLPCCFVRILSRIVHTGLFRFAYGREKEMRW